MRDIKFRAFDKQKSRMFEVYGIGKDFVTENTLDGVDEGTNCFSGKDFIERIEIMQFTGLKDKNLIDIYSGDFDQDGQVVRWCDNRNGWAMSIYDFPTKEHIACHCYNCDGNFELSEITKEIEIKGNIHELK